jgi:hypothetical protein
MSKRRLSGIVALCLGFADFAQGSPVSVTVTPTEASVVLGSSVSIAISVNGLEDAGPLNVINFQVAFDPNILDVDVMFGDPMLGNQLIINPNSVPFFNIGLSPSTPPMPGLSVFQFAMASGDVGQDLVAFQRDAFTLATLTFTGRGVGSSPIIFTSTWLFNINGNLVEFDPPPDGRITSVPEPPSAGLLAVALAAIGCSVVFADARGRQCCS